MKLSASGALLPVRGFQRHRDRLAETVLPAGSSIWTTTTGIAVTTSVAPMQLPQSDGKIGPTWLVQVSHRGQRPDDDTMRHVIDCFQMPAHEEDNHFPGVTRSLFCPIDPTYRGICDCKLTETIRVEPDGFTWSDDGTGQRLLNGVHTMAGLLR